MYDMALRRLGYLTRTGAPSPIVAMLTRAGLRPRPLNRVEPWHGTWITTCPLCGAVDGAFIEPGMTAWSALCRPGEFSIFELHAVLVAA